MNFNQTIESLLHENATDIELSKVFKNHIKEYALNLSEIFQKNQGKDFLVKHTKQLDEYLTLMYKTVLRHFFNNYLPMRNNIPITLVALGSYGREQLSVYSDIDLMIVYEPIEGYNIKPIIEKLLYRIWDSGLQLGHRVHTVEDLQNVAKEDITIKTALIESRFITGSSFVWIRVEKELNIIRQTKIHQFLNEKIEESRQRRKKHGSQMQPNIKEGIGGLRDAQVAFWIAKTIYGINTLKDLSGIIYSEEFYKEYRLSLELLYKTRTALHITAKKKQDKMVLEYATEVAEKLGFSSVVKFATKLLQAQWYVNRFSQIVIKKMMRPYFYDVKNIKKIRGSRIANGLYFYENILYSSYNRPPISPLQLLKLLNSLQDEKFETDASFLWLLISTEAPKKLSVQIKSQIRLILYRQNSFSILKLLYNSGLLEKFFPPLKKALFQPQFDGYHSYPVDIHSLKSIKALENIKDPFIKELHEGLSDDEKATLKLAVLIHDAGKGGKRDHSITGATLFKVFAKKIDMKEASIGVGATLIRNHTKMTEVAFREDIYNEKILFEFVSLLQTPQVVKMLYILTYADINGVGGGVYSSHNAQLLKTLYSKSLEVIGNRIMVDEASKRLRKIAAIKKEVKFEEMPSSEQKKLLSIESNLLFIKYKPQEIISFVNRAAALKDYAITIQNDNYLTIRIMKKVPLNLGYLLGQLTFLDIASMDTYKLYDDIKYFKIEFEESVDEETLKFVEFVIKNSFDMQKEIPLKKPEILPNEIKIECRHSKSYIRLKVNTRDQKGLLAYLVKTFDDNSIDIVTSKVHTQKNRTRDMFLIEKRENICNNTKQLIKSLTKEN